jgi:hypothetical protein
MVTQGHTVAVRVAGFLLYPTGVAVRRLTGSAG